MQYGIVTYQLESPKFIGIINLSLNIEVLATNRLSECQEEAQLPVNPCLLGSYLKPLFSFCKAALMVTFSCHLWMTAHYALYYHHQPGYSKMNFVYIIPNTLCKSVQPFFCDPITNRDRNFISIDKDYNQSLLKKRNTFFHSLWRPLHSVFCNNVLRL